MLAGKEGWTALMPPFPSDLQGFGRRVMHLPPDTFYNTILYQVGALSAFLKLEGLSFSHLKVDFALLPLANCY